jgi:outer membrane protein assembly factor BamB
MRTLTRTTLLILLAATVACGERGADQATPATDLLYFQTPKGVAVLAAGATSATKPTQGVPSTDWSSVVTDNRYSYKTEIEALDARRGVTQWTKSIPGPPLEVKVVSQRAEMVALTPFSQNVYVDGRRKTTLVVAGRDIEPRTIELEGNYEPEAFSTDGNSVFVLQYLPAHAPVSYRVRRLDLRTEKVVGVYSVDAELQEAMRGTARIQAMSPDGTFLYTLYTTGGGRFGPRRAFIHVLNLDELWAHCIDLPEEFGQLREPAIAITTQPDGKRLYVTDSDSGATSVVDAQTLEVLETKELDVLTSGYSPIGVHDGRHTLYLGRGPFLSAIDTETLEEVETWTLDDKVTGLQLSADASKLYVALAREVLTLDAATGKQIETTDPPGVGRIDRMGPVMRKIEQPLSKLTCAC